MMINSYDAAYLIRTKKFYWNEDVWLNGKPVSKNPYVCCKCGTNLMWNYQEDETYLIKCNHCETITVVQACSPNKAMEKVGKPE